MSTQYYYFAASLPVLQFGQQLPFTIEEFKADCERLMKPSDYSLMELILSGAMLDDVSSANNAFTQMADFERQLRNEAVLMRAQRLHKDPNQYLKGDRAFNPKVSEVIKEASKLEDLLAAEKVIDSAVWQFIDELQCGHFFDLEYVLLYGWKIRILNKYDLIASPKGKECLDGIKELLIPSEKESF